MSMRHIFLCVLSLSLSGALTGAVILMVRPFTKKLFSKSWNYYIWLLVAARLLLPVYVDTGFSDFFTSNLIQEREDAVKDDLSESAETESFTESAKETENLAQIKEPVVPEGKAGERNAFSAVDWVTAAGIVWILGVIISLFIKIKDYRHFMAGVRRECEPVADQRVIAAAENLCGMLHMKRMPVLYESTAVSGPITVGVLRTAIVLPMDKGDLNQLPIILHHELLHVKKRDLWYKWLYQILLCIHWFNPILYLIGRKINIDCELACDEAVIGALTGEGKKAYGNILLDAAKRNISAGRNVLSLTLLERKEDLKERLKGILQYKKKNGMKVFLSCCMTAGLLLLSACGSIRISPDEGEGRRANFWDKAEEWLDSGVERFLNDVPQADRNGDAWKAYDDDALIAGEDIKGQWHMYSYMGGKRIDCKGMYLNGAVTILIVNTDKDVDIDVNSAFDVTDGRFKVVHVDPDDKITVISDTGQKGACTVNLKTGRNVIKLVGQEGRLRNLKISYSGLWVREKEFESIYFSQEDEETADIKADMEKGIADKDVIMEHLYDLDQEDISQAFRLLLKKGEELSPEEIYQLIIYSDSELSGRYLAEAIRNGEIEPLGEAAISEIKYYLDEETLMELLEERGSDLTFDLLYDCAPYLDSSSLETIARQYLDAGGEFTELQWNKLSAYLDEDEIEELKSLKPM